MAADLSQPGGPEGAVDAAVTALGGLDILVNNVGAARQTKFDELTDGDWQSSFAINLMSHIRATMLKMVSHRFMRKQLRDEWKRDKKRAKTRHTLAVQADDVVT